MIEYGWEQGYSIKVITVDELRNERNYGDHEIASVPMLYFRGERQIYINPAARMFTTGDPEAEAQEQARDRWWAIGSTRALVDHEIGHARHHENLGDQAYAEEALRQPFDVDTILKISAEVSSYAATSPVEFVAETYTALVHGKTFGAEIMAIYKGLGGVIP